MKPKRVTHTVNMSLEVMLPQVPNFIRTLSLDSIPIAELSDDSLRKIGQEWTAELLRLAQFRRREKSSASATGESNGERVERD